MIYTLTRSSKMADQIRLGVVAGLLVAGIAGFYYFSTVQLPLRIIGFIVDIAFCLYLLAKTSIGQKALMFMREAQVEVRKVIWPTRQETLQSTLVVCALVFVVGLFLWLLDMLLFWGVGILSGQKV